MQCYNHEVSAVGTCKHCCKALCIDCITEVEGICACKNSCESAVAEFEKYRLLSQQSIKKVSSTYKNGAIFNFICGLLFFSVGIIPVLTGKNYGMLFLSALGLAFFYGSYSAYKSAKRIQTNESV